VQDETAQPRRLELHEPRLREMLPDPATLHYVGRDEAASPATGSNKMHKSEELELVQQALEIAPPAKPAAPAGTAARAASGSRHGREPAACRPWPARRSRSRSCDG
jgi:hypothetical protein